MVCLRSTDSADELARTGGLRGYGDLPWWVNGALDPSMTHSRLPPTAVVGSQPTRNAHKHWRQVVRTVAYVTSKQLWFEYCGGHGCQTVGEISLGKVQLPLIRLLLDPTNLVETVDNATKKCLRRHAGLCRWFRHRRNSRFSPINQQHKGSGVGASFIFMITGEKMSICKIRLNCSTGTTT
jgi:hypothetical protein